MSAVVMQSNPPKYRLCLNRAKNRRHKTSGDVSRVTAARRIVGAMLLPPLGRILLCPCVCGGQRAQALEDDEDTLRSVLWIFREALEHDSLEVCRRERMTLGCLVDDLVQKLVVTRGREDRRRRSRLSAFRRVSRPS